MCTLSVRRMSYRKWRGTNQQLIWWPDLAVVGCCLVSLHFLCDILSGRLVAISLLQNFQELLPLSRHHPPYLFLVFLRRLCWFHFPLLLPPTYIPVVVRRCGHGKRISPSRNVISLVPGKSILCGFLLADVIIIEKCPANGLIFFPSFRMIGWFFSSKDYLVLSLVLRCHTEEKIFRTYVYL